MDIRSLVPSALALVVAAITLGMSAKILTQMRTGEATNTGFYNATTEGIGAMQTFSEYLGTIAIVVVAAIVIGVILTSFYFKTR